MSKAPTGSDTGRGSSLTSTVLRFWAPLRTEAEDWAPWCPVCLQQAPGVRTAAEQYGDRVAVVGVAGLANAAEMPEFIRLAKVESTTNLSDEPGEVWLLARVAAA